MFCVLCIFGAALAATFRSDAVTGEAGAVDTVAPRDQGPVNEKTVLGQISDGFVLWSPEDRLLLHNGHAGLHHLPEIREGMTFAEHVALVFPFIHEQTTGGNLDDWLAKRLAWHSAADGTHEMRMKNDRWVLLTERRAANGSTVTTYTDITARKRVEHELVTSERRLAHAQKLAEVGVWEWNTETGRMYWSDIMCDIHGLSPETEPLSIDQYFLMVHPASRDIVQSTYKRLLSTGGKYDQEYRIIRPDNEVRAVRAEVEAIAEPSGRIMRVIGAVHDVTEMRRGEWNLRHAKESADEANRAKSEFLANVSHELRTPLNAIIGFSEVMLQEVFGPLGSDRYRDYAGDIRQSGGHLLGVINDLLDYSKLEAGHLELHLERVDLSACIEKCLRIMRERAEAENVTLVSEKNAPSVAIEADERKLMQILFNLVGNAIKFTPSGGLVTVKVENFPDAVEVSVTDTGIGMTKSEIDVALSPFGQVDSAMNRRHAGTGLGLPLSKALAEQHGGTLAINSKPGVGTTVTLRLDRKLGANDDGAGKKEPSLRLVMGGQ
jgi:PAS domain S-box-containing protein